MRNKQNIAVCMVTNIKERDKQIREDTERLNKKNRRNEKKELPSMTEVSGLIQYGEKGKIHDTQCMAAN